RAHSPFGRPTGEARPVGRVELGVGRAAREDVRTEGRDRTAEEERRDPRVEARLPVVGRFAGAPVGDRAEKDPRLEGEDLVEADPRRQIEGTAAGPVVI